MTGKVKPIPDGYRSVTPYLVVDGAAAAIDFYKAVFNASEHLRIPGPNDRIGHAELMIGDCMVMLADEHPELNIHGPRHHGGSPVSIMLYVPDVDAVAAKAVAAGARMKRPVADQFYGDRMGTLEDPFGHSWHIATHIEDVSPTELERRMKQAGKA
jgi:PhnB protein